MKFLLTLLIVIMPVVANGQGILATAEDTSNTMWGPGPATIMDWGWDVGAAMDSLLISTVKHDTTKEYVKETADKCDTAWTKAWMPFEKIRGVQYFKRMAAIDSVHCYVDTTWADKKLVYLTPDEMKKLKKLLRCHD